VILGVQPNLSVTVVKLENEAPLLAIASLTAQLRPRLEDRFHHCRATSRKNPVALTYLLAAVVRKFEFLGL
jgi:hypothetical protein